MNKSIIYFFLNSDFSHWARSNEDSFASRVTQEQSKDSFPKLRLCPFQGGWVESGGDSRLWAFKGTLADEGVMEIH